MTKISKVTLDKVFKQRKRADIPGEIALYRSITGFYPHKLLFPKVISAIRNIQDAESVLKRCYIEWLARGYNPRSIHWIPGMKEENEHPKIDPEGEYPATVLIQELGYGSEEMKHWKVSRTVDEIVFMKRIRS